MYYKYPINDAHIHVFDPDDLDACIRMVDYCGYEHWTFLACTLVGGPFAQTQNLLCALAKLKEGGRCQAFGSFHYDGDRVPDADNLLEQIRWFSEAGFDGIKMLDGKPGVRLRQNLPLDAENYDKMFTYAERTQFPILYHINDPGDFWYRDRLPEWAVKQDFFYGGGDFPRVAFAGGEEEIGFVEGEAEAGGLGALGGGEILVAGGAGEPVGFADGGAGEDLDGEAEVADHAADDAELLGVLLAEDGQVGEDDVEELGDDGADAVEVAGDQRGAGADH